MRVVYAFNMGMTVEQIAEAALSLPSEARAQLADRLVESLDAAADEATQQVWVAEAIRRRDEVRSGRARRSWFQAWNWSRSP